jgi:hypothetical protein
VDMKSSIFWVITPCNPLKASRRFGRIWELRFVPLSRWFLYCLILRPWKCRQFIPTKSRLTFKGLHGVISQEIELHSII